MHAKNNIEKEIFLGNAAYVGSHVGKPISKAMILPTCVIVWGLYTAVGLCY